jgi:phospholipid/cholesterol/gamma-HCH transport system substrate-binding protein
VPKLKREYSIALLMIGGVVLLVFGINYLKGLDLLRKRNVYHAIYHDVSGITDATPVLFNGYKVGQVLGTALVPDGTGRIAISFQMNEHRLPIPKDSRVEIYGVDLFTQAVRIVLGNDTALAEPGDTLLGNAQKSLGETVTSAIDPLKAKAEAMITSIDSVLTAVQQLLNPKARGEIDKSLTNLRASLENINSATHSIDLLLADLGTSLKSTMNNLNKVSVTLANNSGRLDHIFSNVDSLTTSLAKGDLQVTLKNLAITSEQLKQVIAGINEGKGTLGKLAKDDSLYVNLTAASHELDVLLEDLRTNPNRYLSIFGKKDRLPKLSQGDIERIQKAYEKQHKP